MQPWMPYAGVLVVVLVAIFIIRSVRGADRHWSRFHPKPEKKAEPSDDGEPGPELQIVSGDGTNQEGGDRSTAT